MNGEQNINPLFQYDDGLTDSQSQAKAAGLPYKHLNPQKTLRDEFAMHVDIGDIDGYTKTFQEAVVGRAKPDYAIDTAGWIRFWNDFEMTLRYLKADAAMKAREVQS